MTNLDARAGAMIGAFERIEAAQKLKIDRKGFAVDTLPEQYWSLIAEAQVFADLACADLPTALAAGTYLNGKERRIRENRERAAAVLAQHRSSDPKGGATP